MEKDNVISTEYEELDELLGGGFRRKEVNILASRPGEGNTVLLFDIAKKMANQGKLKVYYLHTDAFDKRILKSDNIAYRNENYFVFGDYPRVFRDKIKYHEPDVVIIDSLCKGCIPWVEPDECMFYHLSKIAKEFNVAIIVSNLLDRSMYQRRSKQPKIDDMRIHGDYREFVSNVIILKSKCTTTDEIMNCYSYRNKTICVYDNKKKELGCFNQTFNISDEGFLV